MKIVVDEHVPEAVVNSLSSNGYEVLRAGEEYQRGGDDTSLLEKCSNDGRILLTNDRDFVRLSEEIEHSGVIIYTDQSRSPREILRAIINIEGAYGEEIENKLVWLQGWI